MFFPHWSQKVQQLICLTAAKIAAKTFNALMSPVFKLLPTELSDVKSVSL
jgi:hypothetical protein